MYRLMFIQNTLKVQCGQDMQSRCAEVYFDSSLLVPGHSMACMAPHTPSHSLTCS